MLRALQGIGGLIALVAGGVMAVAMVDLLSWNQIAAWFSRRKVSERRQREVAFTLLQHLENGNYKTVYGLFDQENDTVVDGEGCHSKAVDQRLADLHKDSELVLYARPKGA
jgi:hypothetical protein